MNILVLGSGAREHAICRAIKDSKDRIKLWCFPGNAGIDSVCEKEKLKSIQADDVVEFCKKKNISLVVPGSEEFLDAGIADALLLENIQVFGPSKYASKLETSKIFTKKVCHLSKVKTAKWSVYKNAKDALVNLKNKKFPLVLKMDSLAAGKGVSVAKNYNEASLFLTKINKGLIGNKSSKILLEELLIGEEASFFFTVDGKNAKFIGSAKDYKRVGENNTGPNTGGMGCVSPSPLENSKVINKVINKIIYPTLKTMEKLGHPYKGILYAGLMFTKKDIFLIEYNVRLGDPECQAIMNRLKTNFLKIILSSINNNLNKIKIEFKKQFALCVVIASEGYPEKYKKGFKIKGIPLKEKKIIIYQAGTELSNKRELLTNGGRVLNLVVSHKNLIEAKNIIYKNINSISWKGAFYRKDIGE